MNIIDPRNHSNQRLRAERLNAKANSQLLIANSQPHLSGYLEYNVSTRSEVMSETTVGIRELKNRLSEYLRRVKAGETVIITQRGKPVGQIMPIEADLTSRLRKMVDAGVVEWNGQPVPPYQSKAVNHSKQLLSDLVAQERE
jgi:prevent-host-death family protein